MENELTQELSKRIFGSLGIVDSNLDNQFGIYNFPIDKKLTIITENNFKKKYPLYSAKLNLDGNRVGFLSAKIDDTQEKFLVVQEGDVIFLLFSEQDNYQILIKSEDKIFPASIFMQLQLASLIEFITNHGLQLQNNNDYNNLYDCLVNFIEHTLD